MDFKDYYQTLDVDRAATAEDIKKAFRKMARKYHPDVSKHTDAEAHMKDVNEAYAVLSDPEKRAAYDQLGNKFRPGQDFQPPPGWDAGFEFSESRYSPREQADFSDFFAELFGRMGGTNAADFQTRHRQTHFSARGEDHHAKTLLDIEDAFTGATRQISLRSPEMDARGRVVLKSRTLNVKIPKGVRAGQVIRLAGQGAPGSGEHPAGDLLLEIQFNPHPRLRAEGRDVRLTLPVAPWEAALGAIIDVELPNGPMKVRIPEGAQSGKQLHVRGKGLPSEPPGDLLLDIQVVLPPADSTRARSFYETMAKEFAFDPRKRS